MLKFKILSLCIMAFQAQIFQAVGHQSEDSLATITFLEKIGKVELMSFRVSYRADKGRAKVLSREFSNFNDAMAFEDSLHTGGVLPVQMHYYISDEEKDFKSVMSYIGIIQDNDLYIADESPNASDGSEQLFIAANQLGFKPFYRFRSRILTDIKFVILIGILTLFMITFLFLLFFIFYIKSRNARRERLTEQYIEICREPLSTFLFTYSLEEVKALSFDELAALFNTKDFKKSAFKNTLINEIINLNKNLKGDFKDKLRMIFTTLRLDDYSIKKLRSRNWEMQATGTVEVYEMNIDRAAPYLDKLLHSKNFVVRSNAVRAFLHLSPDKDLSFLSKQSYPLSRWQQMWLYRVIKNTPSKGKIDINSLLKADNESVRIFGIKLVRLLGRMDIIEELSEMFSHASNEEQYEILRTFKALAAHTRIELVHKSFQSDDLKLATLSAELMGVIGNEISVALIIEKLNVAHPFVLEKVMLKSLSYLDREMMNWAVRHFQRPQLESIKLHLNDGLLEHV
ncbi:hypothetical protein Echvi_3610 [Echinicola vietnamensis DSM 17526]|uniref:HEAT repeat protein n=2 Tax=Echinicola TaxID=390846 RepID=L0G480_ECHVK|nr:hypothetical protein Echvi_3610 [Echinicola vietnamensis DSM 17526]